MTAKRLLLLSSLTLSVVALVVPGSAAAFKLVKAGGGAITKSTQIHVVLNADFESANNNGFKCEINGTFKTANGEAVFTSFTNIEFITNKCEGYGIFKKCEMAEDAPNSIGFAIESNALSPNLTLISNMANCFTVGYDLFFKPMKVIVGTGPITAGILEGSGTAETDEGPFAVSVSGTMTVGQYTEEGVNKGSAKGVFQIE